MRLGDRVWLWRWLIYGVVPGCVLGGLVCARMVYEARHASYTDLFGAGPFGLMMLMALSALSGLVVPLALGFREYRKKYDGVCVALVIGLVAAGTYQGLKLSDAARISVWTEFSAAARPLVQAVERHIVQRGKPPKDLAELVPGLLDELPKPPGGRPMEIVGATGYGEPWRIVIRAGQTPGSFGDRVAYHPSGNYPRSGYSGVLVRMGDWGYYYE